MLWDCSPDPLGPVLASICLTLIFSTPTKPVCSPADPFPMRRHPTLPLPAASVPCSVFTWRQSARQARSRPSQRYDLSHAVDGHDKLENNVSYVVFLAPWIFVLRPPLRLSTVYIGVTLGPTSSSTSDRTSEFHCSSDGSRQDVTSNTP
jgi:hypothetical protein